jgi:hypothetical protein
MLIIAILSLFGKIVGDYYDSYYYDDCYYYNYSIGEYYYDCDYYYDDYYDGYTLVGWALALVIVFSVVPFVAIVVSVASCIYCCVAKKCCCAEPQHGIFVVIIFL